MADQETDENDSIIGKVMVKVSGGASGKIMSGFVLSDNVAGITVACDPALIDVRVADVASVNADNSEQLQQITHTQFEHMIPEPIQGIHNPTYAEEPGVVVKCSIPFPIPDTASIVLNGSPNQLGPVIWKTS